MTTQLVILAVVVFAISVVLVIVGKLDLSQYFFEAKLPTDLAHFLVVSGYLIWGLDLVLCGAFLIDELPETWMVALLCPYIITGFLLFCYSLILLVVEAEKGMEKRLAETIRKAKVAKTTKPSS